MTSFIALQRVAESTDAHNKLQSNLSKTMQEIYDQEKHIAQLKKAIRDKEAPLKVWYHNLLLIILPKCFSDIKKNVTELATIVYQIFV